MRVGLGAFKLESVEAIFGAAPDTLMISASKCCKRLVTYYKRPVLATADWWIDEALKLP